MNHAVKATPRQIALHQEARQRLIAGVPTVNDKRVAQWRAKFRKQGK